MPKSNAERQKDFHKKMLVRGNARVVVYAPKAQASEIRGIAAAMRERACDPDMFEVVRKALIESKGALSASVDENTKIQALGAIEAALTKCRDYEEPI
jgi:hypothetical protein|tara:strand:+ start:77 stop:370 length:294 start_codon:yes stop_codon:yes gene_type:complete